MVNVHQTFLDYAQLGRSRWWAYLAGWLLIVPVNIVASTILYISILVLGAGFDPRKPLPQDAQGWQRIGINPLTDYLAMNATFLLMIFFVWLAVRLVHGRPFLTVVTGRSQFDFARAVFGFLVWMVLSLVGGAVTWAFFQRDFSLSYDPGRFMNALPLVLLCTPVQCFAEEIVFRGYLIQTCATFTKHFWMLAILNSVLFALPHMGNPGVDVNPGAVLLSYVVIGLILAAVTLRSNGIETAVGMHIANNLFCAVVLNYTVTPLYTPSIFLGRVMHPWTDLCVTAAMAVVSFLIFDRYERRRTTS